MSKKQKSIGFLELSGFTAFSTSTNIVFNFKSLFYLYFLTNVLMIDVKIAGLILALGTVWDAINDPLIGLFSANHTFKNGEKVRPFALWCAIPWAVTIVLMFCDFKTTGWVTVVICLAIYFIFEALYTFLCMPYNSMGALATNDDAGRKAINGARSLGGCLGSGIGAVAITPLVKVFGGLKDHKVIGPEDSGALLLTACLMGVICIIGCWAHYFTTKERVKPVDGGASEEKLSLIQAYKMLFKSKMWVMNMFYIIGYGITTALVMNNINYYGSFIMGDSSKVTPILAVYLVVSIIFSILTPSIDAKIGRKPTMIIAAVIGIVGKIPFIFNPYSMVNIYINAFTVAISGTVCFVMFNTNRNNIADVVEWKNGRRIDSMVAAGDNLASKLAEAGAVELMTVALGVAGFVSGASAQPETAKTAICGLLGWVPAIVCVFMLIIVLLMDVKTEPEEARAGLAAKKAALEASAESADE